MPKSNRERFPLGEAQGHDDTRGAEAKLRKFLKQGAEILCVSALADVQALLGDGGGKGVATSWIIWPSYIWDPRGTCSVRLMTFVGWSGGVHPRWNGWTVAPQGSRGDTQDTFHAGYALQLPPDRTERLPGNLPQRVASPTYGNNVLVWWFGCSNQYLMENSVQIEIPRVSHDVPIYLL